MAEEQKILRYEELNDEERRKIDEILEAMLECNQCNDIGSLPKRKWRPGLEKVDEYMQVLPGADYVLTQTLNYIFSNGLTTGSINQDEKLNEFLYRKNAEQTLNKDVLRNTIGMAITHGACGLRWLDGNIYQYKWGTYKVLTITRNGIKTVLGYLIKKPKENKQKKTAKRSAKECFFAVSTNSDNAAGEGRQIQCAKSDGKNQLEWVV